MNVHQHLDHSPLARLAGKAGEDVAAAVTEAGCALAELYGIGSQLAGKILARVGAVCRFRSAAAFAAFDGTTPIEVSSGDVVPGAATESSAPGSTPPPDLRTSHFLSPSTRPYSHELQIKLTRRLYLLLLQNLLTLASPTNADKDRPRTPHTATVISSR